MAELHLENYFQNDGCAIGIKSAPWYEENRVTVYGLETSSHLLLALLGSYFHAGHPSLKVQPITYRTYIRTYTHSTSTP